eukprot:s583_g21.t1
MAVSMGEAAKWIIFGRFRRVATSFRVAGVAMGEAAKWIIFGRFRRVATSFRVAGVALRDIPTCFKTCRKSFCVAGAILSRRFQELTCIFRGRRSTLDTSIVIFRGRRSTLDVSCCVFCANRIVRAASRSEDVQIVWQSKRRCLWKKLQKR